MKKIVSLLLMGLLVSGTVFAKAQPHLSEEVAQPERKFGFMVNPLALIFLAPSVNFQFRVADHVALVVPLYVQFFTGSVSSSSNSSSSTVFGAGTGFGAKFFLSGKAFEDSLYILPLAEIGFLTASGTTVFSAQGSAIVGYGWVWNSGFSLNLGLGLQYIYVTSGVKSNSSTVSFNGIFPDAEFSLGYSW